ncbi:MAG TPA: hypothetical protein VG323_17700 [Thermoanaerobaculia bacterium]|nr:hypothetical protein [Thermoanaerobaculia bacterium]
MRHTDTTTTTTPDFAALVPKLIDQVRSIRDQIPGFTLPHPSQTELRGPASNVPQQAVDAAISASLAHKALAESIDAAQVQSDEDFARFFADFRDELNILFTGIDYTIRLKRFNAGQATLNVLSIARRLARKPENAHLNPHIEAIEKGLHRRRRNNKPSEQQPPPSA